MRKLKLLLSAIFRYPIFNFVDTLAEAFLHTRNTLEIVEFRIHKISEMRKCPAVRLNVKESCLLIGYSKFSPTTIDRQNKNYESRFTNIVILYLKYIRSPDRPPEVTREHEENSANPFLEKKSRILIFLNFGENWNNYRKTESANQIWDWTPPTVETKIRFKMRRWAP